MHNVAQLSCFCFENSVDVLPTVRVVMVVLLLVAAVVVVCVTQPQSSLCQLAVRVTKMAANCVPEWLFTTRIRWRGERERETGEGTAKKWQKWFFCSFFAQIRQMRLKTTTKDMTRLAYCRPILCVDVCVCVLPLKWPFGDLRFSSPSCLFLFTFALFSFLFSVFHQCLASFWKWKEKLSEKGFDFYLWLNAII